MFLRGLRATIANALRDVQTGVWVPGEYLRYSGDRIVTGTPSGAPTGPAGGDLSGTYPDPDVAKIAGVEVVGGAPSALDVLTAIDATSASWQPPATTPFDVATDIGPEYWWIADPANTVQSGGLVDTLTNIGSGGSGADFAQTGSARAPLGTDGNGCSYLDLDGTTDFYQTASTSWQFTCDGPWTLFVVLHRPTAPLSFDVVLDLLNVSSANVGFSCGWAIGASGLETGTYGPFAFIANGNGGNLVARCDSTAPRTGVEIWTIAYGGRNTTPAAQARAHDMWLRRNASLVSTSQRGTIAAAGGSVSTALTLGRNTSIASGYSASRIYEILMVPRLLSDRLYAGFEEYARAKYFLAT